MNATELRGALERVASSHLGRLDPTGVAIVEGLLSRAEAAPEIARERILSRAAAHLEKLEARATERHRTAVACIEELEARGHDVAPQRSALARGEHLSIRRTYLRTRTLRRPERRAPDEGFRARLRALASELGVTLDESMASPVALAGRLYRKAAADASAERATDRALSTLPPDAGRYNAATVAALTLRAMRESSVAYLRAHVARLDAFASVHSFATAFELAEAEEAKKAKDAKKKAAKKAPKRKSS